MRIWRQMLLRLRLALLARRGHTHLFIWWRKIAMAKSARPQGGHLPKSREVLAMLLAETQQFLDVAEAFHQRQRLRARAIAELRANPDLLPSRRHLLGAAGRESRRQFAHGIPTLDCVMPYLKETIWPGLMQAHAEQVDRFKEVAIETESFDLELWLARFEEMLAAERALLDSVRTFQMRVIEALDDIGDTGGDTRPKIVRALPRSMAAIKLYHELQKPREPGKSQNEIAMDFAARNGGNWKSLLRSVQRFKQRQRDS